MKFFCETNTYMRHSFKWERFLVKYFSELLSIQMADNVYINEGKKFSERWKIVATKWLFRRRIFAISISPKINPTRVGSALEEKKSMLLALVFERTQICFGIMRTLSSNNFCDSILVVWFPHCLVLLSFFKEKENVLLGNNRLATIGERWSRTQVAT